MTREAKGEETMIVKKGEPETNMYLIIIYVRNEPGTRHNLFVEPIFDAFVVENT